MLTDDRLLIDEIFFRNGSLEEGEDETLMNLDMFHGAVQEFERLKDAEAAEMVKKAVEARDAELKNILSKVSDGAKERSARMDSAYGKAYFEDVSALIKFMASELFPSGKDEGK